MERFIKLLWLMLSFVTILLYGFLSVLLVGIGAETMKLALPGEIGYCVITGIAFLFPLSLIGKVILKEMKE